MSIAELLQRPRQERLAGMEQLWDLLCRDTQDLESPAWHQKVLTARKERLVSPDARFLTLAELRKRFS